jgi:hypothetical protein
MNKNKEMMVRICVLLSICSLTLGVSSILLHSKSDFKEHKLINVKTVDDIKLTTLDKLDSYSVFMKIVNDNKLRIIKKEQEKELKRLKQIANDKANKIKSDVKVSSSRGGYEGFKILQEVECQITYYSNSLTRQEGGRHDKKGKLLENHDEPICALPSDVPYGYYLILNESVRGEKIYKNVDTGGAIHWLNDEHTKMKVDIFIPDVTEKWLYNNTKKKIVKGWICKDN